MNPKLKKQVRTVAEKVRKWCEENYDRLDHCSDMCGMCAIAAGRTYVALKKVGIQSTLVEGDGHCFVLVKGYIVDVTATQFDDPEIVIIKHTPELVKKRWYYKINHKFKTRRALLNQQRKDGWPKEQWARW